MKTHSKIAALLKQAMGLDVATVGPDRAGTRGALADRRLPELAMPNAIGNDSPTPTPSCRNSSRRW